MKKKKSLFFLFTVFFTILAIFVTHEVWDRKINENGENKKVEGETIIAEKSKQRDALIYGITAPPEGIYSSAFYSSTIDAEVLALFDEPLISYNENMEPEPNIASWKTEDNKTFHFTFEKGVKWHNGEELTVNDWAFALETIASSDYDGPRYKNVQGIEGVEFFHSGKAEFISGIKVINDYEIIINFEKEHVNNLTNLWMYALPQSVLGDLPVAEISVSEWVHSTPIGIGPFKVKKVVPGESVEFSKFDNYWNGNVNLEKIIMRVIDESSIVDVLQNGEVDMITLKPITAHEVEDLENIEIFTYPGRSYYYIGFKLGKFDSSTQTISETWPKYESKDLREALMYAIDRQKWVDKFFFGYGDVVNKPVPSAFWNAADESELISYQYDPAKSEVLLEKAGYRDLNDDGFREDKNGEEFIVKFYHYATGNPTFEKRAKAIVQYWEAVGIKTELEMIEVNLYYNMIEKDDPLIETFFGGWETEVDSDPASFWKADQLWNYTRYNNTEADQLLDKALNHDIVGINQEKRIELYTEWQKILNKDIPMLYMAELKEIKALNKHVGGVKYDVSGQNNPAEWFISN